MKVPSSGDSPDDQDTEICSSCAGVIPPDSPAFGLAGEIEICFECAIARGAVYDADRDAWTVAPRLDDPHAP